MALYLGSSEKLKIQLDNIIYNINLYATPIITNGNLLLSSDNYILKDSNGFILIAKEGDEQ